MQKTGKSAAVFLTILVTTGLLIPKTTQPKMRVAGYYPDWYHSSLPAAKIQYKNLTDILHAFIWPKADGSLVISSGFNYADLTWRAQDNDVNLLVALGGWGQSAGFSPMAASAAARQKFIQNLVDFCQTYEYRGVDFDWEYPETAADRTNLTTLVRELRTAFDAVDSTLIISMAIPSGTWTESRFDFKSLHPYLDWFGCMCYDFHGSWTNHAGHNAPLFAPANETEGSADISIRYLIGRGIPTHKILLGIPFYGRMFNATALYAPATGGSEVVHHQIDGYLKSGWVYHWDDLAKVPYLTNPAQTQLITFDDTTSVRIKTEYARGKNLGGVMLWALGQDFFNNRQPLLETIARTSKSSVASALEKPISPDDFILEPNYPNPFNSHTCLRYFVRQPSRIRLEIFNLAGQEIEVLVDAVQPAGWHQVQFDARNQAAGVYFYRLRSPDVMLSGKMIYLP